jgi:hypothetical protein
MSIPPEKSLQRKQKKKMFDSKKKSMISSKRITKRGQLKTLNKALNKPKRIDMPKVFN